MLLTVKEILLFFGRGYRRLFLLIKRVLYIYFLSLHYLYYIVAVFGISDLNIGAFFGDRP